MFFKKPERKNLSADFILELKRYIDINLEILRPLHYFGSVRIYPVFAGLFLQDLFVIVEKIRT